MNQQINLYQPRFRPRRQWLSAKTLLPALGVMTLILIAASLQLSETFEDAQLRNQQLQQEQQQVQRDLTTLQRKLEALLADDQWKRRAASLRQQLHNHQIIIDYVAEHRLGDGQGFAAPLAALTAFGDDQVWLERILLSEQDIELHGAALDKAAIPRYFEQLKQQQVFAEHSFDRFEIRRSPKHDWKLEFVIATREEVTDE